MYVGRLTLLYLSYSLSLFRMVGLISWVIHGNDGLVPIVRCTYSPLKAMVRIKQFGINGH